MLTRDVYLRAYDGPAPDASVQLEQDGFAVLRDALPVERTDALRAEMDRLFAEPDTERRRADDADEYRYAVLNRSALVQELVADRAILDVVEPLLGHDCHVIANTAWRNPPGRAVTHGGGGWHCDAGPHVPRPAGTTWPRDIPYPIFAVAVHVLLEPMPLESGPTGVIPSSHRSGQAPPADQYRAVDLTYDGQGVVPLVADTGDIAMFVSDIWHRRLPTGESDPGRDFIQIHYGRRDIAQRLRTTEHGHQLSADAVARAGTDARARTVVGLHEPFFYDG